MGPFGHAKSPTDPITYPPVEDGSKIYKGSCYTYNSMCIESPIFIVGSPRSGTSLLSRIIGSHPEIGIPFESHLYPRLYPWRKVYGDLSMYESRERIVGDMVNMETIKNWEEIPEKREILNNFKGSDFHSAFRAIMEAWLSIVGKKRWGEKTPHNIFFWKDILEGFPDSRFIHIVRDGRDVAMSWKKVRFGPEHFYPIANLWNKYIEKVDELKCNIDSDRFHEVKYEEILIKPEKTIKKVCNFLGERFYYDMMLFYKNSEPYPTDSRNERNLSRPILRRNMNKWRSSIRSRNLRIFEAVAGETLERYGYDRGYQNASLSRWETWQIKFVECPVTRLFGLLKDVRGGRAAVRSLPLYVRLTMDWYLGVNR